MPTSFANVPQAVAELVLFFIFDFVGTTYNLRTRLSLERHFQFLCQSLAEHVQ